MAWVLRETRESNRRGVPVYLEKETNIGPCCTETLEKAERFFTKGAAMQTPAFSHALSFFEPEYIDE